MKEQLTMAFDWVTNQYTLFTELVTDYISTRPILGLWFTQILRYIGFSLGLFGAISVMNTPAPELGKYELAYQIMGKIIFAGSSVTLVSIIGITIILVLTSLKI